MFTNKNKLIGFIALVVVAVLVVSAAVALIADNANKTELAQQNAQLQEKLDKVQAELDAAEEKLAGAETDLEGALKTIAELDKALTAAKNDLASAKGDLTDAKARVEALENKIVELVTGWAAATPEVHGAVVEIQAAYDVAMASAYLYANAADLDGLYDAKMDAIYAVIRSTSVENLKAIVDGFKAEIAEIEANRFDNVLKAMIEAVKVDGVTHPEDVAGVEACEKYLADLVSNTAVYDKLVELGLDKEVEELRALLNADEKADLEKAFIDAVALIPEYVQLSDKATVEAARAAYGALNSKYPVVAGENVDVDEALKTLLEAEQRLIELVDIVAEAEAINALIASTTATAKADSATRDAITTIANRIAAWEKNVVEADPNWTLVDRDAFEALKTLYNNAVEALKADYDAFKAAVEAIGQVTPESGAAIDAAWAANTKLTSNVEFKEILGNYAAGYDALLAVLKKADADFKAINDLIDRIRKAIDAIYNADPITVSTSDLDALEALVTELTTVYGQKIEVINTVDVDYVARLAYVRLIPHKNAAIVAVEKAYAEYQAKVGAEHGGQYNLYYELSVVNSQLHQDILGATTLDAINAIVAGIDAAFADCLK